MALPLEDPADGPLSHFLHVHLQAVLQIYLSSRCFLFALSEDKHPQDELRERQMHQLWQMRPELPHERGSF